MTLPANYHRDWQRDRAIKDPAWYEARKSRRTQARREHKKYWVKEFGGACADCRGVFHPSVFDFHHIDEDTKDSPDRSTGYVFMYSKKRAEKELRKCVLLCANCHRLRHVDIFEP